MNGAVSRFNDTTIRTILETLITYVTKTDNFNVFIHKELMKESSSINQTTEVSPRCREH